MLARKCRYSHGVSIESASRSNEFLLKTEDKEFRAPALVVATGGLSIPKIGATDFGYALAKKFGLAIRETRPGLVPLIFNAENNKQFSDLAGVSTEITASCDGQSFREKMLITHRGLSGPAVLQVSSYWKKPQAISIDLIPGREVTAQFQQPDVPRTIASFKSTLQSFLPQRLAHRWADLHAPSAWTNTALNETESQIHHWRISPSGTEGYEKAEVTVGGVDTDELFAKSMECRKIPGSISSEK